MAVKLTEVKFSPKAFTDVLETACGSRADANELAAALNAAGIPSAEPHTLPNGDAETHVVQVAKTHEANLQQMGMLAEIAPTSPVPASSYAALVTTGGKAPGTGRCD